MRLNPTKHSASLSLPPFSAGLANRATRVSSALPRPLLSSAQQLQSKHYRDASTAPPSDLSSASSQTATTRNDEAAATKAYKKGTVRVTDKRSNPVDNALSNQDASEGQAQSQQLEQETSEGDQAAADAIKSSSHEDLLKQRFYHAQSQNKGNAASSGSSSTRGDTTIIPAEPQHTSDGTASSSSSSDESNSGSTAEFQRSQQSIEPDPRFELHAPAQSARSLEVPFDTHAFVRRLEEGGWVSEAVRRSQEAAAAAAATSSSRKGKKTAVEPEPSQQFGLQLARSHDPAEAIMEHVRFLITQRGRQAAYACLNKGDVENQAYLFNAALSELRTEVQVRARNDVVALRSITTLLQREVDALEQKMKEDVERLKHDIQVDMSNRKAESKEEQNNLEQDIQDLNNRFTISLSDLKTEIEQNVKWDATRRSLFLVFGIAAIVAANLAIADYLTRDDEAAKAAAAQNANAGNPPASANAAAPASLSWAAEGRVLSPWPIITLGASLRFRAGPILARFLVQTAKAARPLSVASVGLMHSLHTSASHSQQPRVFTPRVLSAPRLPGPVSRRQLHSGAKTSQASLVAHSGVEQPSLTVPDTDLVIGLHPTSISLQSQSLGLKPFHFDHVWLRDACQSEGSVHMSTKQKLFHTSDVPLDVPLLDASQPPSLFTRESSNGAGTEPVLRLTFAKEQPVYNAFTATFGQVKPPTHPHVSDFSISFLLHHALPQLYAHTHMDIMAVPQPWEAKDLTHFKSEAWSPETKADPVEASIALALGAMARPARVPWDAICPSTTKVEGELAGADAFAIEEARNEALYALTEATLRDGFAFVTGLPTEKTATEAGPNSASLRDLAEMMGEIRNTFYGPLWDVQSKASSRNIAYTNLDLGLHMDLLYFQNPPRFQFLHMLRNKVVGGASIFVDSFKVAERMWEEDRSQWEILTKVPVGFHYVNDGRHYRFTHPTFELAHDTEGHSGPPLHGSTMPRLSAVNYSPPFQSPLPLHPTPYLRDDQDRERFYAALKRFADLTLSEEFRYEKQMEEGECVIFDNRRVLHSRKGFEWNEAEAGEVKRWLKGCYVDGDAIWSTYRTLRTKLGSSSGTAGPRGVPTSGRTATNLYGSRRMFSTSTRDRSALSAEFAPSSDDPTVMDARSRAAIGRAQTQPLSMTSYRPVPPLTLSSASKLYRQLSKSRLTFLVVLTGMAGYALCPSVLSVAVSSPVTTLLAFTVGTALCSATANALNQLVEAPYDAQMPRTRARPLPSRAVTPLHAFTFASVSAASGIGMLSLINPLTAALGAANIVLYSFTYTPMKRMSIANTWVGAVVGALPPLMGWAACTGTLHLATDLGGWALAALLFAWQFPHFNSLAHTLRAEYARGGYRMMAVTDPALNRRVSLRYAVSLLPICTVMMPASAIVHPVAFAALSTPLNLAMIHAAWKFYTDGTQKAARWCFWVSLIHLPAVMLLAMGCKPGLWDGLAERFRGAEEPRSEDEDEEAEKLV